MNGWDASPRVLMLHNRYQLPGGEDVSAVAEAALLQQQGHTVTLWEMDNDRIRGMNSAGLLQLAIQTTWNHQSYRQVRSRLQELSANLLHVQNFFPLWSPAVHAAAQSLQIPTVQHLRNFRLGCLNAYLLRQGQVCEICLGRNPWRGVAYACYRQSRPASLGVWSMITFHRWRQTWQRQVNAFITPSQFAAEKLVEAGIPSDRLYVKPDFLADPLGGQEPPPWPDRPRFLFIGRLSAQKGIPLLLQIWRQLQQRRPDADWQLDLLGEGEERPLVEQWIQEHHLQGMVLHGHCDPATVLHQIQRATAVLVPSQSYETFGRVVVEAMACGRPALVSRLGALPELVQDGVTGWVLDPAQPAPWVDRLLWLADHPLALVKMGQMARQRYQQHYTAAINYRQLRQIYDRCRA